MKTSVLPASVDWQNLSRDPLTHLLLKLGLALNLFAVGLFSEPVVASEKAEVHAEALITTHDASHHKEEPHAPKESGDGHSHKASPNHGSAVPETKAGVSPSEALGRLIGGNHRFVAGKAQHPNQSMDQVKQIAGGQHPFAVVLACADSRVAPEVVFDQGLGELFTIRIAGNSALDDTIGSIEYAIEHLGVRLIVVLGHERCGAVKAAVELAASGGEAAGHLGVLLHAIGPAVDQGKDHASGLRCSNPLCRNTKPHEPDAVHCRYCGAKLIEDKDYAAAAMVELTVCNHARLQAALLRESTPVLKPRVMSGEIKIVAARYDLDTGEITLL